MNLTPTVQMFEYYDIGIVLNDPPKMVHRSTVNSIKRNGIRQNLIITPVLDDDGEETDDYRLIAGHRRLAAAKKANLISVPCRIERDLDEADEVMAMLEENMQRSNLTFLA